MLHLSSILYAQAGLFYGLFLHSFGLSNTDLFMADSAASHRGLAPSEASRKSVPDG